MRKVLYNFTRSIIFTLICHRNIYSNGTRLYNIHDRTIVGIDQSIFKITHKSKIMFIGSCFTEMMSKKLSERKFTIRCNPQGILFNPLSISKCLENILDLKKWENENSMIFQDHIDKSLFHSWEHHSAYSSLNKTEMLSRINHEFELSHDFLKSSEVLFLTLGSSFVHSIQLDDCDFIVANCHKRKY